MTNNVQKFCVRCKDIMMRQKKEILRLRRQIYKYKKLATHDTLTKLYNRRQLEIDLPRYLNLQKRRKEHFLILMIDIDKFKKINDTKGHKEGDKILIKTAKILKQSIRNIDKVYRLEGDEFIVILSHCYKDKVSERIKQNLVKENVEISIGKSKLKKDILDIIDQKMYEEKRKKR